MAWYYGTFSCGHEGRVNIIGPVKDRQRKADRRFSNPCDECRKEQYEKAKQQKLEEATQKSAKYELPQLEGTEKQIEWALILRQNLIDKFETLTDELIELYSDEIGGITKDEVFVVRDFILENRTKASYYIDLRGKDLINIVNMEKVEALKPAKEKEFEKEVRMESTVYPENKITNAVAEISIKNDTVSAVFEKHTTFREIVKNLGFKWNGSAWERKISETTGSAEDRAAELGNKLLNAGIPILIYDQEVRRKAIEGDYEQECKRWILHKKGTNKFAIWWSGYNNSLYNRAKSLPGARWDSETGTVLVDVAHYEVVEEFAKLYGFRFAKNANELTKNYKKKIENAETVVPATVEEKQAKDGLKEILESSDDIIDDLKD